MEYFQIEDKLIETIQSQCYIDGVALDHAGSRWEFQLALGDV